METALADQLAGDLLKKVNKAVREFNLIEDGDRILVAVSGGKDSLSLLRLLQVHQRSVPHSYDLIAAHVQMDFPPGGQARREQLETLFKKWKVAYTFEEISMAGEGRSHRAGVNCFRCAWNRRKALFLAADRLGANKIAFGHHADDIAQTTLLNLFFHGRLETMAPRVEFFQGRFTVIRPLTYVEEKELAGFAQACGFPVGSCRCPYGQNTQRARLAALLREIEKECPRVKYHLWQAVRRCQLESLKR